MRLIALFMSLLLACPAHAACTPETLSSDQQRVLYKALEVAPTFLSYEENENDLDFSYAFAGLLYQESSFCQNVANEDDPSYGCGGVTPETARDVAGTEVSAWMLQHNETLNLNISAQRLLYCAQLNHGTVQMDEALFCYNHGPGVKMPKRVARDPYVRAVKCRVRLIRAFLRDNPAPGEQS